MSRDFEVRRNVNCKESTVSDVINISLHNGRYGDGVGDTVEVNSSMYSLTDIC